MSENDPEICVVLCCAVMCCAVMCCAVLSCAVMCWHVLSCAVPCCHVRDEPGSPSPPFALVYIYIYGYNEVDYAVHQFQGGADTSPYTGFRRLPQERPPRANLNGCISCVSTVYAMMLGDANKNIMSLYPLSFRLNEDAARKI